MSTLLTSQFTPGLPGDSTNIYDMNRLMELFSTLNGKLTDRDSLNSESTTFKNLDIYQEFDTRGNTSSSNMLPNSWLESFPIPGSSTSASLQVGNWSHLPHKPIGRSQSAKSSNNTIAPSPPHSTLSQCLTSQTTSPLGLADILRNIEFAQHRSLSRTASDPVSAREKLVGTLSGNADQESAAERYKTELCRTFQEYGTCKYGEKCQFAHGKGELRKLVRHPKYKTDRCKTYHSKGFCPYGPRCHFIHEESEIPATDSSKLRVIENDKLLRLALIAQSSTSQGYYQNNSDYDVQNFPSMADSSTSSLPSTLFTPYCSTDAKYNSLNSIGTTSPSSSIAESPTSSPTSFMLDGDRSCFTRFDSLHTENKPSDREQIDSNPWQFLKWALANQTSSQTSCYSGVNLSMQYPYSHPENQNELNLWPTLCNSSPTKRVQSMSPQSVI